MERFLVIFCCVTGTVLTVLSVQYLIQYVGWLDMLCLVIGTQAVMMSIRGVIKQ